MRIPRIRLTIRRMMAVVVLAAIATFAGMHWLGWREAVHQWWVNRPVWEHLNRAVSIHAPNGKPFEEILGELRRQTVSRTYPKGLPLYIDPIGLQDAGVDTQNPPIVKLDVDSVPLKEALDSVLKKLGLKLHVRSGIASITSEVEMGPIPKFDIQ